jgi:beta-glucosidase
MALCGFARVHVTPGEAAKVSLEIPAERLRYWDTTRKQYVVEPGDYVLMVGAASDDIRVRVPFKLIGP